MRWITRERPKVDRVACPWLIARFIDRSPEFLFVPPGEVTAKARSLGAIPFDVEGVDLSHDGPLCSFDAFLRTYQLDDPALHELAAIVRGADTEHLELAPESAGLLAISLGLSHRYRDDEEVLRDGFVVYDALYEWLRFCRAERHTWNPQRAPVAQPA
ncbi:MAG: chromate resistance protein ChrB domain-containing protein [Gemmatimonadales bacterium]